LTVGGFAEEEEDVKPSVEYLNSLNEYRKRSRSADPGDRGMSKTPRLNDYESPHSAVPLDAALVVAAGEYDITMEAQDDPTVYGKLALPSMTFVLTVMLAVNGEPMAFSAVTEEHQEMMTPEEYTAYYEVVQSRS
jgi:transcription initiation factor TFIIE subunit alpha